MTDKEKLLKTYYILSDILETISDIVNYYGDNKKINAYLHQKIAEIDVSLCIMKDEVEENG